MNDLRENESFIWKIKRRNSKMKKLVALLLAVLMLSVSFAALAEVPEGYPEIVPEMIQAEKKTITIYDYWSGDGARAAEPNDEQQAQYDYRDWIEATYNVKIEQKQGGDWGTCAQEMIDFYGAADGSYRAYIIEPGKVGSLVASGYAASWGDYDFSNEKWNQATIAAWSKNGEAYGVSTGATEPRGCLYFNKRVLEEAGIDWNTIYDMQAEGTWTWDVFEGMLKQITKDVDNDGVNDIWGMLGSGDDMYVLSVFSNKGSFFDFDENGKLYPSMNSQETIDALTWAKSLMDNYFYKQPADGNWDYYKAAWKQGFCGFYVYQTYGGFNDNSEMADMEDEWGCVAWPVPKPVSEGYDYIHVMSENTTLIPNVYTAEEVQMIAFFIDLWTNPTPGYDDEDAWIGNKYNYTDERAVDETYAMLRKGDHALDNKVVLLGTQNDVLGSSLLWGIAGGDPAALIEAGMPAWQALCDTYNAK